MSGDLTDSAPAEPELTLDLVEAWLVGFAPRVPYPSCIASMDEAKEFFREIHGIEPPADAFTACCDACEEDIEGIAPFGEYTHKCGSCGIGFVLCGKCVAAGEVSTGKCPKGRGCGELAVRTKLDYTRRVSDAMFAFIIDKAKPRVVSVQDLVELFKPKVVAPSA